MNLMNEKICLPNDYFPTPESLWDHWEALTRVPNCFHCGWVMLWLFPLSTQYQAVLPLSPYVSLPTPVYPLVRLVGESKYQLMEKSLVNASLEIFRSSSEIHRNIFQESSWSESQSRIFENIFSIIIEISPFETFPIPNT